MKYDALGASGIVVSRLCLGTMMFGKQGNADHDECTQIIHKALDSGVNFIDTADVYSYGESEEIVRGALAGRRDQVVLATKVHHPMSEEILNRRGSTRSWIIRACEDSLRRLGTDYIDLYQLHRPDPLTDIDETLGALSDLVRQGKVRAIGSCTFPASEIVEARVVADQRNHVRLLSNQPPYSIFARGIEREVLGVCQRYGMGVLTYSPLNSGWLTGRYRRGVENAPSPRSTIPANRPRSSDEAGLGSPRATYGGLHDYEAPQNQRKLDLVEDLMLLATEIGIEMTQLSVAFVLSHRAVTSSIIGPRTMEQLTGQLKSIDCQLSEDALDRIDVLVPPGTDVFWGDAGYMPPEIGDSSLRRRPSA